MYGSENLSERLLNELSKLIRIAKKKDYKLNYTTVLNLLFEHKFNMDHVDDVFNYFIQNEIEIVSEGVEPEEKNVYHYKKMCRNIEPFDQTKIDINMHTPTLDLIIKRLENKEIDLMPDFQRKAGLWNAEQKSRLIESLMLRIPLPAFYFDGSNDENWLVIDGLQRLTTIKEFFIDEKLKLQNLEFMTDYQGCTYKDLPRTYIRRMEETQIIAFTIKPGTPPPVKYNIFKRINTSGLELSDQEIRHAIYQGKATSLLQKLSKNENFLLATCKSIKKERMEDREFILRFIAFRERDISEYEGYIDDFLNSTMELINNFDDERLEYIEQQFNMGMKLSYYIFGNRAFRKMYSLDGRRNPINRALFDTWSICLSRLLDEEIGKVKKNKEKILDDFIKVMNEDKKFANSYLNSSKTSAVKERFKIIKRIIEGVIE